MNQHVWYDSYYNEIFFSNFYNDRNITGRYLIETIDLYGNYNTRDLHNCIYLGEL